MNNIHENLSALGQSADSNKPLYNEILNGKNPEKFLERFLSPGALQEMNPYDATLSLNITTNEFTSLCPMTGQPDFAEIIIDYIPEDWCVESKSLKLYFLGFRNRRDFHESCVTKIANDLIDLLQPRWIKVTGKFTPRGGIPFHPTVEYFSPDA